MPSQNLGMSYQLVPQVTVITKINHLLHLLLSYLIEGNYIVPLLNLYHLLA